MLLLFPGKQTGSIAAFTQAASLRPMAHFIEGVLQCP